MKHPTVPAPEHIKPVLREVLSSIKEEMSTKEYRDFPLSRRCLYICHRLEAIPGKESAEAAKFIQESLGQQPEQAQTCLGSWLIDNDEVYNDIGWDNIPTESHYENLTRVAWLEWLTQPQTTE